MPKILSKINLPQYAAAPGSPVQGDMYYNTTDDTVYVYDGAAWLDLAAGGGGTGDITAVVAGSGLTGGATTGSATLDVGAGTGISVSTDAVAIDTTVVPVKTDNLSVFATSTSAAIGVGSIELGHATDTTITRSSAGVVAVEGVALVNTNDARLTDSRTPTAHATSHKSGGTDAIKLNEFAAPDADVSLNSNKITNLATPTSSADAATKAYVDAVAEGLDVKASCRLATTADHGLSGLANIDGFTPLVGDRILVKNQTTASQNGIYVAASGSWSRAEDAAQSGEITPGTFVFVEQGTANADSGWVVTTNGTITIGATDIIWTQFSGAGQIDAGIALTKTGNTLDVDLTDATNSTSTTTAATPNSVKQAYDLANAAIPKNTVTATGDILYASGSATVTKLAIGTANQVLTVSSGVPAWTTPSSSVGTADANGTYGVTTLGTATNSASTAIAATPSAVKTTYDFASTKAKVSVGTAQPSSPSVGDIWVDTAGTLTAVNAIPSSSLNAAGAMIYASGVGTAASLAIGTPNQVLAVSSGTVPSWTTLATASISAVYGITSLTDSVSSTSTTTSATPNSVKTAYDTAATAIPKNTVTAAGDMLYASGSAVVTRLPVGTANQVLTVQSNTPTWTTPTVGSISTITGTATFGAITPVTTVYSHGSAAYWTATNGTVLVSMLALSNTAARRLFSWNLSSSSGTITPAATATPALTYAGTVQLATAGGNATNLLSLWGKGFSGNGIVFNETVSLSTSGSVAATLRKYTSNLATNSWNTTIYSPTTSGTNWGAWNPIAFGTDNTLWVSEANSWVSWDRRTTASATAICYLYSVNDTTGTLYSIAYATATASNSDDVRNIDHVAYVPPSGGAGADGTVHIYYQRITAAGGDGTARELIKKSYVLTATGFTAVGTVAGAAYPGLINTTDIGQTTPELPYSGYWDAGATAYVMNTTIEGRFYYQVGFDRSLETVLWRTKPTQYGWRAGINYNYGSTRFDSTQRTLHTDGNGNVAVFKVGDGGAYYSPRRPIAYITSPGYTNCKEFVLGNGSASHVISVRAGGSTVATVPLANMFTSFTIPSSTSARMIMVDESHPQPVARPIATIEAGSAFPGGFATDPTTDSANNVPYQEFAQTLPMILPANQTAKIWVNMTTSPFMGAYDAASWYTGGTASSGATATYGYKAITLL